MLRQRAPTACTVITAVRALRREAFVDVAERLIRAKGYEQMTVQDVLEELDASRGAFYHYFDSKVALLEAVVEHMVDAAIATLAPVMADPDLAALTKLERLFSGIAACIALALGGLALSGWGFSRRDVST
jgi:AcrR family transcriptional regulator